MELCRLCGGMEFLIDIFRNFAEDCTIRQLICRIFLATGIEIKTDDIVSKMICEDCFELVKNSYQFRINSAANDFLLKKTLKLGNEWIALQHSIGVLNEPLTINPLISLHKSIEELFDQDSCIIIPNDLYECNISSQAVLNKIEFDEGTEDLQILQNCEESEYSEHSESSLESEEIVSPQSYKDSVKQSEQESFIVIESPVESEENVLIINSLVSLHKSIEELFNQNPNIIIPNNLYECNISPQVVLHKIEIENRIEYLQLSQNCGKSVAQNGLEYSELGESSLEFEESILALQSCEESAKQSEHECSNLSENAEAEASLLIKEEVSQCRNKEDPLHPKSPLGNLIIKRAQNCNNYEVINCIRDDTISTLPCTINCDNDAISNLNINNSVSNITDVKSKSKQVHKRKKPDSKYQHICDICNNLYNSQKALKIHQKIHLQCRYCKDALLDVNFEVHQSRKCVLSNILQNTEDCHVTYNNKKEITAQKNQLTWDCQFQNKLIKQKCFLKLKPLENLSSVKPPNNFSSNTFTYPYQQSVHNNTQVPFETSFRQMQMTKSRSFHNPMKSYGRSIPYSGSNYTNYDRGLLFHSLTSDFSRNASETSAPGYEFQHFQPIYDRYMFGAHYTQDATVPYISQTNIQESNQLPQIGYTQFPYGLNISPNYTRPQYMNSLATPRNISVPPFIQAFKIPIP